MPDPCHGTGTCTSSNHEAYPVLGRNMLDQKQALFHGTAQKWYHTLQWSHKEYRTA